MKLTGHCDIVVVYFYHIPVQTGLKFTKKSAFAYRATHLHKAASLFSHLINFKILSCTDIH